ncbi:MAG: cellulase family glycosylhydrolase [Oscillospiraceae bacterium]|nr:cellulase family glycosylhydrolase [Oscillospiraceae bacterium]
MKKKTTAMLLAAVMLMSLMFSVPVTPTAEANTFDARRIRVSGQQFVVGSNENPQRIWINGVNTPWDRWDDFGGGSFRESWWDNHFRSLNENGVNATRVWISCRNNHDVIQINAQGMITGVSQRFWDDLDVFFALAEKHEIYVMATLVSFDHFKAYNGDWAWMGRPHPHEAWRTMLQSAATIDSFVNHYTIPFVERYKSNPYLWSIDLVNEPDWTHENDVNDNWLQPNQRTFPWTHISHFVARNTAAIRSRSDVLVTVGLASVKYNSDRYDGNMVSDARLQAQFNDPLAALDFWSPHYYDWVGEWFGHPFTQSPQAWGLDTSRPSLIGETGANGTVQWIGTSGQRTRGSVQYTLVQDYENAFNNGWQGVMSWTSNGVDNYGTPDPVIRNTGVGVLREVAAATNRMRQLQPALVRPNITGGATTTTSTTPATSAPTSPTTAPSTASSPTSPTSASNSPSSPTGTTAPSSPISIGTTAPTTPNEPPSDVSILRNAYIGNCPGCSQDKIFRLTVVTYADGSTQLLSAKRNSSGELLTAGCSHTHIRLGA